MKKTIAKIMAAAMVLSTVVAPNVNASTSFTAASNGGIVDFTSLGLVQQTATTGNNIATYPLIGASNDTVGSRLSPIDAGGSANKNSLGNITSVTTDLYLVGQARGVNGNIVYVDADNGTINSVVTAADTTPKFGDTTDDAAGNKVKTMSLLSETTGASKATTKFENGSGKVNGETYESKTAYADALLDYAKANGYIGSDVSVSEIQNVMSDAAIANNNLKTTVSVDGLFKETKYNGADIFNGITISASGRIQLDVASPSSTTDALINAALNGTDPVVMKVTLSFNANAVDNTTGATIADKSAWIKLANNAEADYDGYVILHKDNGENLHIGVNYTTDSSGYATITKANATRLASDTVKGGRLWLDYVYDRTNTSASIDTGALAYKIRVIDSRVFKDGKFQAISGRNDDGAKWIRHIHNGAFRSCKQLKKVNLDTEKKLRKINAKAFKGCKKLATVKMDGRNLKQIGSKAFEGTKSNITFKVKGNKTQFNKAVKKLKKAAPKKAKFSRL